MCGGGGVPLVMHGRSRVAIDPCMSTTPGEVGWLVVYVCDGFDACNVQCGVFCLCHM